jgi:hypothetical protein
MSDNVTVTLTVRKKDLLKHSDLLDFFDEKLEHGEHVTLTHHDVKYSCLNIESELANRAVPFDKDWDSGDELSRGSEYCRVLANGNIKTLEFLESSDSNINIDAAILAFNNGDIASFLESKKNEKMIMSWEDQEIILAAREKTEAFLSTCDQDTLDDLVIEMTCEVSLDINNTDNEDEQEAAISNAESDGSNINNGGAEIQIAYLLSNGYLSEGQMKHSTPRFQLRSTEPLWNSDEVQFPRLICEISSNCQISPNDWNSMLDSMDLDDDAITQLFDRADVVWEKVKARL